jgi:hypothetical protein
MAKLLIVWPALERPEEFDQDYLSTHVPLAARLPGGDLYTSLVADRHAHRVTIITYPDEATLRSSLTSDVGAKCKADTDRLSELHQVRPRVHILTD